MRSWVVICALYAILVSASDKDVLMELYKSTGGPNWTNQDEWNSGKSICAWYGITCAANGDVFALNLPNNNMNGQLPSNLGDLKSLQNINVAGNTLSGEIPKSLANLDLASLVLSHNKFGPTIPGWLSKMTNLVAISLDDNAFSEVEHFVIFNELCKLEQIYLGQNHLRDFPTFCTDELQIFDASDNPWSSLDFGDEFDNAANLNTVNLNGVHPPNSFELPSFAKSKLQALYIADTALRSYQAPFIVADPSELETLFMKDNPEMHYPICPVTRKDFPKLQNCDLSGIEWSCPVDPFPASFCHATCHRDK